MLLLYFIVWSTVFCINTYCSLLLYRSLLLQKVDTYKILIFNLTWNIIHIWITDYLIQSYILKFVSMCMVYFIMTAFMFEGSVLKKIIVYIENLILVLVQEVILSTIIYGILRLDWKATGGYSPERIAMHLGSTIIAIIIYPLFIFIQKKIQFVLSSNKVIYIVLCLISQVLSASIFEIIMIMIGLNSDDIMYAFITYIIFAFFVDIYLLNILAQMEIKEITEQNIEQTMKQDEIVAEYYSEVATNINNLAKLKESYSKELSEIYKMSNLTYDETVNMTSDESKQDNVLVSNIMYNVKRQLDKLNCKYEININIPKDINIDSIDLASLLINVFDNAVEALSIYMSKPKRNKSAIHLKAFSSIEKDRLIISVENVKSSAQKTKENENKYVSSKENKELHGYGMQILQKIADKYGGKMKVEYTDTRFLNSIELKIQETSGGKVCVLQYVRMKLRLLRI